MMGTLPSVLGQVSSGVSGQTSSDFLRKIWNSSGVMSLTRSPPWRERCERFRHFLLPMVDPSEPVLDS